MSVIKGCYMYCYYTTRASSNLTIICMMLPWVQLQCCSFISSSCYNWNRLAFQKSRFVTRTKNTNTSTNTLKQLLSISNKESSSSSPFYSHHVMYSSSSIIGSQKSNIPRDHPLIKIMRKTVECDILPAALDQCKTAENNTDQILLLSNEMALPPKVIALLAVSGGCDSVGLLHGFMTFLSEEKGYVSLNTSNKSLKCETHIVHFNHRQRGSESDKDESLVRVLCEDHGVPFHCFDWDDSSGTHQTENDPFSQEKARIWRRKNMQLLLSQLRQSDDGSVVPGFILSAHHADDNDETVLMKLLRGAHISSLSGMSTCSMVLDDSNENVAILGRPLLNIRKKDIQDFLLEYFPAIHDNKFPWREDESNKSGKYMRNRVRNELMPLLSELSGGEMALQRRLLNLSSQSAKLKNYLNESDRYSSEFVIGDLFTINGAKSFDIIDEEALFSWVVNTISESGKEGSFSYEHLQQVMNQLEEYSGNKRWCLEIGAGWIIERCGEILSCYHETYQKGTSQEYEWTIAKNFQTSDYGTKTSNVVELNICIPPSCKKNFLSRLRIEIAERNMHMKFKPHWKKEGGSKKLKDLLRGQKVPLHLRSSTSLVIYNGDAGRQIIALHVPKVGQKDEKWIIHADFYLDRGSLKSAKEEKLILVKAVT